MISMPESLKQDEIKFWLTIITVAVVPAVISFVTTKFQVNMNTQTIAAIETKLDTLETIKINIAEIKKDVQFLREQR